MKVSKNREVKSAQVKEISDKIKRAKSLVFVDYRGLNVASDTAMRKEMRKAGCDYNVYKNRIMSLALAENGIDGLDANLQGTLAVAFSYSSEIDAAKVLKTVADEKKVAFKFGLIGSSVLDENSVKALANLPSREVLIAQLLGLLNGPATGLASVLAAPVRSLAVALNAIASK